jgi:chromosome segregation protein
LISFDPAISAYMASYLSGVVVVEDTETALELMSRGKAARLATLGGVFFDGPGRVIVAGGDDVETTILDVDNKLGELAAAIEKVTARERKFESRRDELAGFQAENRRRISETRGVITELEQRIEAHRSRRRDNELAVVRVKEKIVSIENQLGENEQNLRSIRERLEEAVGATDSAPADPSEGSGNLAATEDLALSLEREKEALAAEVAKLKVENVSVSGETDNLQTKIRNVEKLDEELRQLVKAREEDTERCREQVVVSEEDIGNTREAIAGLHAEKKSVEDKIDEVNERYEAARRSCEETENELRQMKDQRDAKRENLERVSIEIASVETRINGLLEKARDNYDQDLQPWLENRSLFDPAEWEEFDREVLEKLKAQLENFGPVNMLALDEYNEKKERLDFLTRQKEDLEEARNALVQAIRRINREARRLLRDTFEQVRQNFKQTFLTLFDGGEVDLLFVDSDDPLEANIKIVANPKGKRLHDISSLSSGERALVALSLLFGIYLVKPSPFCVFDEVDAPLDDANIARFVRLLKSFTDRTQFIVITHNKKTMEAADNLYGVTMEEPGVSKLVSIRLDEAERFRRHRPRVESVGDAAPAA